MYVYINTPPDVCAQRQRARNDAYAVTEEYLRRIEFQYQNFLKFCNVPVIHVDGTLPPEDLAGEIIKILKIS